MAPAVGTWKNTPKWWFMFANWRAHPVRQPHFSPAFPNKERLDQVDRYVVFLSMGADDDGHQIAVPAINLRGQQGSHLLLFESTSVARRRFRLGAAAVADCTLTFHDEYEVVLPMSAAVENTFDVGPERIRLTALLYDTTANLCPPIDFGERVEVGQRLFFYDLRYGNASLVETNATCVGEDSFVLDAKWCTEYLLGALVFDETNRLVGVVYHHLGSPVAIHIDRLTELLFALSPGIENMDDFHQYIQQVSAALDPPHD